MASVTLMHVAFSGPSSDGYVGWGIPANAGRMIGGNAVIVYPHSAATTGELSPHSPSLSPCHRLLVFPNENHNPCGLTSRND